MNLQGKKKGILHDMEGTEGTERGVGQGLGEGHEGLGTEFEGLWRA